MRIELIATYDPEQRSFKRKILNQPLYEALEKGSTGVQLCRLTVLPHYIFSEQMNAHYIWVALNDANTIIGFVFLEHKTKDILYLSLMCASEPNVGKYFMEHVIVPFAKAQQAQAIYLESIPTKVSYWKKFGFVIGRSCDTLHHALTAASDFHDAHRAPVRFEKLDAMLKNVEAQKFIQQVSATNHLVSNYPGCKEAIAKGHFDQQVEQHCLSDGIRMFLCFNEQPPAHPLPALSAHPLPALSARPLPVLSARPLPAAPQPCARPLPTAPCARPLPTAPCARPLPAAPCAQPFSTAPCVRPFPAALQPYAHPLPCPNTAPARSKSPCARVQCPTTAKMSQKSKSACKPKGKTATPRRKPGSATIPKRLPLLWAIEKYEQQWAGHDEDDIPIAFRRQQRKRLEDMAIEQANPQPQDNTIFVVPETGQRFMIMDGIPISLCDDE